ncbi:hypothetical protein [Flavobacterium sp. CLA17]|uniref:hypothetical protein n=1 Tax=Flavobacterium sp. CLA17 TaxID=2724135 RepID=UPI00196753E8|nr:hypothetical protein [Flavobacterium sp. CLA17]QSB29120.1 hypothetical protein HAV12_010385 [Flavobacterium sp. CLA17]
MKKFIKSIIMLGLILTGLLFSCKKQDGYSDEVQTTQTPVDTTNGTVSDSAGVHNTDANAPMTGTQAAGAQSTGSQSGVSSSGNTGSGNNNTKGTGTGSGPGPSAKDGSAYAPSSDPKNAVNSDTIKKKASKTQN